MSHLLVRSTFLLLAIFVVGGCGSSPKENYYTLSTAAGLNGSAPSDGASAYSVALGPITLPEVVDRQELVLRVGPNEVTFVELHRWAGSLKSEIPRIIADNLAGYLNIRRVTAYPQSAGDDADYRVLVDIQRFDSTLGDSVTIDALWTVRRQSDGKVRTGRSTAKEPTSGREYDALVAGHSRALATVSREIAEAIRSIGTISPR